MQRDSWEAFLGSILLILEKGPFQESPLLEQPMRTSKHLPDSLKPELRILHIRAGKGVVNSFRGTEFRNFKEFKMSKFISPANNDGLL